MNYKRAADIIAREEGYSAKPYYCPTGYPTIGYGTKIGNKNIKIEDLELRVNTLSAKALLHAEVMDKIDEMYLNPVIASAMDVLDNEGDRILVLVSMAYQVGSYGLSKFKKMLYAIIDRDWEEAAKQCLDSLAARQAPKRFERNAECLRTGYYPDQEAVMSNKPAPLTEEDKELVPQGVRTFIAIVVTLVFSLNTVGINFNKIFEAWTGLIVAEIKLKEEKHALELKIIQAKAVQEMEMRKKGVVEPTVIPRHILDAIDSRLKELESKSHEPRPRL